MSGLAFISQSCSSAAGPCPSRIGTGSAEAPAVDASMAAAAKQASILIDLSIPSCRTNERSAPLPENNTIAQPYQHAVEREAHDCNRCNPGERGGILERRRSVADVIAEPTALPDHLGNDHDDERDRQRNP